MTVNWDETDAARARLEVGMRVRVVDSEPPRFGVVKRFEGYHEHMAVVDFEDSGSFQYARVTELEPAAEEPSS